MANMENLYRTVDDSKVDAPARCLAVKRPSDWLIELARLWRNRVGFWYHAEGEDRLAHARQLFIRRPWVAIAQVVPRSF